MEASSRMASRPRNGTTGRSLGRARNSRTKEMKARGVRLSQGRGFRASVQSPNTAPKTWGRVEGLEFSGSTERRSG